MTARQLPGASCDRVGPASASPGASCPPCLDLRLLLRRCLGRAVVWRPSSRPPHRTAPLARSCCSSQGSDRPFREKPVEGDTWRPAVVLRQGQTSVGCDCRTLPEGPPQSCCAWFRGLGGGFPEGSEECGAHRLSGQDGSGRGDDKRKAALAWPPLSAQAPTPTPSVPSGARVIRVRK